MADFYLYLSINTYIQVFKLIHIFVSVVRVTGRYLSVGVSVEYWRARWQLESSEKLRILMSGAGPVLRAPQPPATLRATVTADGGCSRYIN